MNNNLHQVKYTSGIPIGEIVGTRQKRRDYGSRTAESPEEKQAHRGYYLLTHLHLSIQGNTWWCTNSPFAIPVGQLLCLLSQELLNFSDLPIILPFTSKPFHFLHNKDQGAFAATVVFGIMNAGWCSSWCRALVCKDCRLCCSSMELRAFLLYHLVLRELNSILIEI